MSFQHMVYGEHFTIALTIGEQFEKATGHAPHGCKPSKHRTFAQAMAAAERMMADNMNRMLYANHPPSV